LNRGVDAESFAPLADTWPQRGVEAKAALYTEEAV
jgi:hypothetical protein